MNLLSPEIRRLQESVSDIARIGGREVKRTLDIAKKQLERVSLLQRRKELFAELGRAFYEAHLDGLPSPVAKYVNDTELQDIIGDIEVIDHDLESRQNNT